MKTLAIAATCLLALAACKSPDEQKFAQCEDFIKTKGNHLKSYDPIITSRHTAISENGVPQYFLDVKLTVNMGNTVYTYYVCNFPKDAEMTAFVKPPMNKEWFPVK
jgi:hypothetical protein